MAGITNKARKKRLSSRDIFPLKTTPFRTAAGAFLFAVVALLIWGALWQRAPADPFKTPSFFAWLVRPEPHRAYRAMPVIPVGSSLALTPRSLCAKSDACGRLKVLDDGRVEFIDSDGVNRIAARLYQASSSGHLFAITPSGELFTLVAGREPAWRQVPLPPADDRQITTLRGHDGALGSAAFSPDGTRVVTASSDQTARIWDTATGKETVLRGHTGRVWSAAFSPDGSRIVTASSDQTARIWDAATATELAVLRHGNVVTSAAFSPDGSRIVTAYADNAPIWDATTAKQIAALYGSGRTVFSAAFSPDGLRIVTAEFDGAARIFDVATSKLIAVLRGHDHNVASAAFSPDGSRIVTASQDKTARIWETASAKELAVLRGHDDGVSAAAFSPDGSRIVTASYDKTARIWDAASAKELAVLRGHENSVKSAAFSPDGSLIVTASDDTTARIWTERVRPFIRSIASTRNGDGLWVAGMGGYAAYSSDGRSWIPARRITGNDFLAVAAVDSERVVVLTDKNTLLFLVRSTDVLAQDTQWARSGSFQQQQKQQGDSEPSAVTILDAGETLLRTVFFKDANTGWVAGSDGLMLQTHDAGKSWSPVFHKRVGLTLTDLNIEPSGVGWATGKDAAGRHVVVAANRSELGQGTDGWREMPYHIGPWFFLFGIPALLLAGFLNLRVWRPDPPPPMESIEEIATSDEPLRWNDPDARVLKPLARGLSSFLRNVNTKPPLTLAITGRWGSGKSSLMRVLMADLRRYGGRAVWFNAWHHNEEEHLLASLFETIRREATPGWWSWPGLAFRARLFWSRSKRPLLNIAYVALFAGIALITLHLALPSFRAEEIGRMAHDAAQLLGEGVAQTWQAALGVALAGSGSVVLLALWLRGKLTALPANPAKLVAALARRASLGDFSDKLAFRHRFGQQFEDVCNALLTRTSPGLVILIDDLDRCQPADVLKVLEAVNYLVSAGPCTIVLGMDRRQVEYCVGLGFEKLVEGLPDDELIYAGEETPDKAGKQRAYARHYLEKLINIEVPVPALDDVATDALLIRSVNSKKPDDGDGPEWLQRTKRVCRGTFEVARVGLLAFVAGMLLTWGVERWREPSSISASRPSASVATSSQTSSSSAMPSANAVAPSQERREENFDLATVKLDPLPGTAEVPASRRWLWWAPTILLIGVALLFGTAAVLHRERQVVQDSPDFAAALRCVKPLLAAINATPRAIKRYQNRMRYLAARLRPSVREPDRIDVFLHWIGNRLSRQLVPAAWFEDHPRQVISEPALILLGAIELFAPKAFANPAELFTSLEHTMPGDERSVHRTAAWSRVRDGFAERGLAMPTAAEIARYAAFVLVRERTVSIQPGEVVPFARDTTQEPRSA
jgi:WD40 repeat protein